MNFVFAFLLSIFTWTYPQPQHSAGLLVIYGNDYLVKANADWHGYDLHGYEGGLASISPSMLGKIAWIRRDGYAWIGPLLVVDVTARGDMPGALAREEVAEITYAQADDLDFNNGGRYGYVWFGFCPPPNGMLPPAEPYDPPIIWDHAPYEKTPSFFPYPVQQRPIDCSKRLRQTPENYVDYE